MNPKSEQRALKEKLKAVESAYNQETDPEKRQRLLSEGEELNRRLLALESVPNRAVDPATVRVRALRPLAETINGNLTRFPRDAEFNLPAGRAKALGALVKVLG
jgi:hypothetical protein